MPDSVSTAKAPSEHEVKDAEIAELAASAVDLGLIPDSNLTRAIAAASMLGSEPPENARESIIEEINKGTAAFQALETIEPLFAPDDVVELRAIHLGSGAKSLCGRLTVPAERSGLIEFIRSHNGRSNLYFGVNPRDPSLAGTRVAGRATEVRARRTVFLDFDNKDAPPDDPKWAKTIEALMALNPALVLKSGNGTHVHIAIREIGDGDLQYSARPLAAAMKALGSDNVSDAPRIARLPYTLNIPTEKKRAAGAAIRIATPQDIPAPVSQPSGSPTAETVCSALIEVARGLGRLNEGVQGSEPLVGSVPARRNRPAPSREILLAAVRELPNDGPFDDRQEWMAVAYAIKGAADGAGFSDAGREAWLEFCQRWHQEPAEGVADDAWNSLKESRTGWEQLLLMLDQFNPEGANRVRKAEATFEFPPVGSTSFGSEKRVVPAPFGKPWGSRDLTKIHHPEPIYGNFYFRGYTSLTTASPKVGKSLLALHEALDMATGRGFLTGQPQDPLKVAYLNLEDDQDVIDSRVAAILTHCGIGQHEIADNLIVSSAIDSPWHLFTGLAGEPVEEAFEGLGDFVANERPDVLLFDPLQDLSHSPESNDVFRSVGRRLRAFAAEWKVAIGVVHHNRKGNPRETPTVEDIRGGSAIRGNVRASRVLAPMPEKLQKEGRVEDHRRYFQVGDEESNLAPPGSGRDTWFEKRSVETPAGHQVAVVVPFDLPGAADGVSDQDAAEFIRRLRLEPERGRASKQATNWAGYLLSEVLGTPIVANTADAKIEAPRLYGVLQAWLRAGILAQEHLQTPDRKSAPYFVPGSVDPMPIVED